ncbi:hypothetical protein ACLBR5_13575 [Escherichia coli]
MERAGGPAGEAVQRHHELHSQNAVRKLRPGWRPGDDDACIGYLINPDSIKPQEDDVEVDVNSGPCYGRTVCDELGVLASPPIPKSASLIQTRDRLGSAEQRARLHQNPLSVDTSWGR